MINRKLMVFSYTSMIKYAHQSNRLTIFGVIYD